MLPVDEFTLAKFVNYYDKFITYCHAFVKIFHQQLPIQGV